MWFGLEDFDYGQKFYNDNYEAEIYAYGEESLTNGNYGLTLTLPDGTRWHQEFVCASARQVRDYAERAVTNHRAHGGQPIGFWLHGTRPSPAII